MRLALWQCRPQPLDVAGNLGRLEAACRRAADEGADVLVTPEMFLTGYDIALSDTLRLAEAADGPSSRAVGEISSSTGVAVAYGYAEQGPDGSLHNAVQLLDGTTTVLRHRKLHLFESIDRDRFAPGDVRPQVGELRGLRVAALVCYDVEFPETVRSAAVDGARLVVVPTANPVGYELVSTVLVPARAYENGVHVAYADYVGSEGATTYAGLSTLAGPDGVAVTAPGDAEELLVHELTAGARRAPAYLRDRRGDLW